MSISQRALVSNLPLCVCVRASVAKPCVAVAAALLSAVKGLGRAFSSIWRRWANGAER